MRTSKMTAFACLVAVVLVGCFETALNLGSAKDASVDPAYCGEWTFSWEDDGKQQTALATIVNFDGKQYYVQWKQGDEKPIHFAGFLVPVKDATFAQARPLGSDLSDRHVIVRVELKGTKLMLRHLNGDFFEGISTDEAFRTKVEENLNNDAMYTGPWLAGSLTGQP